MTSTDLALHQFIPVQQRRDRWTPARQAPADAGRYTQGALALTYPLAGGHDADPDGFGLTIVRTPADTPCDVPDAHAWAARFMQAVVEVVSSDRPLTQLARWTDRRVYEQISLRQQRVSAHRKKTAVRPQRQQVATVHISQPAVRSAEVAARVSVSGRSRAIAARLDFRRGRWLCTAIRFG